VLADELSRTDPGAAASLREGMQETLTITRLGVTGQLKRTLASTNPCESMIETVRRTSRHVKRWKNGDMCLLWTAAGMLEAERNSARSSAPATSPSSRSLSSETSPPSVPPLTSPSLNASSTAAPEVAASAV
jgi:putative transposase